VIDEDGYVWFTDRLKDAIRRRGENISAYEVEEAIRSHPHVEDVAVFPVKADASEDEVACSVILKHGAALTQEDLIRHCDRNLAYFMVPRYVDFVADFPRTANSKVEKYKLRTAAEAGLGALWDRERAGIVVTRDGVSRAQPK
jgi:crotonobetaine/carnitine-CoA ligase